MISLLCVPLFVLLLYTTTLSKVILKQAAFHVPSWYTHNSITPVQSFARSKFQPYSSSQVAARLVQLFLHNWCCILWIHYIALHHFPQICPFSWDLHLIHYPLGSLNPPFQMASWLSRPFFHNTHLLPMDRPKDGWTENDDRTRPVRI